MTDAHRCEAAKNKLQGLSYAQKPTSDLPYMKGPHVYKRLLDGQTVESLPERLSKGIF